MKCPNCNTELPETAKMCYNCKRQIAVDKSEDNTSKICPNCGISLPLTASMCYCCKYVFNAAGTLSVNNNPSYHTGTLTNISRQNQTGTLTKGQQRSYTGVLSNQQHYNTGTLSSGYQPRNDRFDSGDTYRVPTAQVYHTSGKAGSSSESKRKTAMIVCLIGSIICGISVFMPYMGVNLAVTKASVSIIDNAGWGIEILFFVVAAIIFGLPRLQKNGTGHIVLGIIFLFNCIYNSIRLTTSMNDSWHDFSSFVQREIGFYALLIGSIMVLTSGILMRIAYKNE